MTKLTSSQALEIYVDYLLKRNCSRKTITGYRFMLKQFNFFLSARNVHLHEVDFNTILDYQKQLKKKRLKLVH